MIPAVPFIPKSRKFKLEDGETLVKTYGTTTPLFVALMIAGVAISLIGAAALIIGKQRDAFGPFSALSAGIITMATALGSAKVHLTTKRLALETYRKQTQDIRLEQIGEMKINGFPGRGLTVIPQDESVKPLTIASARPLEIAQQIQAVCSRIN